MTQATTLPDADSAGPESSRFVPKELKEPLSYEAVVFTRDLGPLPAKVVSLYCRGCKSRYYHNYYVHADASTRTYYGDVLPKFIQITQHYFIAREVCEMFATLMNISWTSATNCAKFYNLSLVKHEVEELLPAGWKFTRMLTAEHVWDAFFTYSMLLDHQERGTILHLAHNAPTHSERLRPALQARNALMVGPGQEQWAHACDLCCWVHTDQNGTMSAVRSVVTDGVAIGHPCCGVHDCKKPLIRSKGARYCAEHSANERKCSVVDCSVQAQSGFKTCGMPAHRAMDETYHLKNSAMFQLQARLQRLSAAQHGKTLVPDILDLPSATTSATLSSTSHSNGAQAGRTECTSGDSELEPPPAEAVCEEKSAKGNRRLTALFGRRRTHNEELCVTSCGVILGRATFFGSEAINGVVAFWKRLFPTRTSLPQVQWHDQNCRVWAFLNNSDSDTREYFADVALPVDVFHFKCKHKESDIVCGTHCNPYIWPELRTENGRWRFNSSAAEQCNVWIGKFQAIVREMDVDRYNFFLDEMVKRRNRLTVAELRRQGHNPYLIPRSTLLSDV
ncbi:hypothetical protein OH77DRAFT_1392352 [Trametes cingulata]|nr:hypothetical protein OH77DRAFT_1392352 [Trametes cingulata]